MKILDIVRQMQAVLPKLTSLFSTDFEIDTLVKGSGIVTVKTKTNHGLASNEKVLVKGTLVKNPITSFSLNTDGNLEIIVSTSHDKTMGYSTNDSDSAKYTTARIVFLNALGVLVSDNTYDILEVVDKNTLVLDVQVLPTGTTYFLYEDRVDGYNGFKTITVPVGSLDTFTYVHSGLSLAPEITSGKVTGSYRIAGESDISRVFEHYEKQTNINTLWAYVLLGKRQGSFSRENRSDAISKFTKSESFQQETNQGFNIIVVVPTGDTTTGAEAVDLMQDVLTYLLKSLVGVKFPSGLSASGKYCCVFVQDSFYDYAGSYYMHNFEFQMSDLITESDICDQDDSRSFISAEIDNAMQFDGYVDPARKNAKADL